jgi:HD-GYP domain-containing protein (c-di-GMP phosphodiesterase class II)
MKVAGLLHDVGKVAVPKSILEKKGRLTEEEFCFMKSHVFYTFKILKELSVQREILEWASYHHETLDGNGYPFKLSAKELSLGSRIMAVADVFTALMEDRPYKKGMEPAKALSIIEEMTRDKKLDARVFAVLKANFKTIESHRRVAQERAVRLYKEIKEIFY